MFKTSYFKVEAPPEHAGFKTYRDRDSCENEKKMLRVYYNKENIKVDDYGKCGFEEKDGNFILNCKYNEFKNEEKQLFECGECAEGVTYQCAGHGMFIFAIIVVIFILI